MATSIRSHVLLTALLSVLLTNCMSPHKALEHGNYTKALRGATAKIEKGDDSQRWYDIADRASNELVKKAMQEQELRLQSDDVRKWVTARNKYFTVLKELGEANQITDGMLTPTYDRLCTAKHMLDSKIIDFYYQEGDYIYGKYEETGSKQYARDAYTMYRKCIKNEGDVEYADVVSKQQLARQSGIIYYTSSDYIPSGFWYEPLPAGADYVADCDIRVSYGSISTSTSSRSTTKEYSQKVEVGTHTKTDTAGVVTTIRDYETVYGYVVTTVVDVEMTTCTSIMVGDQTGECTIPSRSFTTSESDSYEHIVLTGDSRAWPSGVSATNGPPSGFFNDLTRSLERQRDSDM